LTASSPTLPLAWQSALPTPAAQYSRSTPQARERYRRISPQRNRIISGVARAVLVVESGIPGGALITAQFAFDQGREVYAIPGNITAPKSAGTNMLIRRQVATPALSPEEFLADLGLYTAPRAASAPAFTSPTEELLYGLLSDEPLHIDQLAERAQLPVQEVLAALLELEFRGLVQQLPGKHFVRVPM
jgi:DNA processing protein